MQVLLGSKSDMVKSLPFIIYNNAESRIGESCDANSELVN